LNKPELNNDKKVKEITLGEDCIYIDLFGGLRLSGPLAPVAKITDQQPERKPRRMIVSGHEAIYDEALALG